MNKKKIKKKSYLRKFKNADKKNRVLFFCSGQNYLRHFYTAFESMGDLDLHTILATRLAPKRIMGGDKVTYEIASKNKIHGYQNLFIVQHNSFDLSAHPGVIMMQHLRGLLRLRFLSEKIKSSRLYARRNSVFQARYPQAETISTSRFPDYGAFLTWFRVFEDKIPAAVVARNFIFAQQPNCMIITPYTHGEAYEFEYAKAAKELGIPVILALFSWDNTTTKGEICVLPDYYIVWNQYQADELVNYFGAARERIFVVGAWRFDGFLALTPTSDRDCYLSSLGLSPARKTILYLFSSPLAGAGEEAFFHDWLETLARTYDPDARPNLLIRPHPRQTLKQEDVLAVWGPRVALSERPNLEDEQALYDDIIVSDIVVGVNTSAMLQAIMLGRPVLQPDCQAVADMNAGLPHADFLRVPGHEIAVTAPGLEAHARQIKDALDGDLQRLSDHALRVARELVGCSSDRQSSYRFAETIQDILGAHRSAKSGRRQRFRKHRWALVFWTARRFKLKYRVQPEDIDQNFWADPGIWSNALLPGLVEQADRQTPLWRLDSRLIEAARKQNHHLLFDVLGEASGRPLLSKTLHWASRTSPRIRSSFDVFLGSLVAAVLADRYFEDMRGLWVANARMEEPDASAAPEQERDNDPL